MSGYMRHIAVVTETWPPEVNGVALTTKRMVDGLAANHLLEVVRVRQGKDDQHDGKDAYSTLLLPGIGLPRYHGLHVGLPVTRRLVAHWEKRRPDLVHVVTEGPLGWSAVRAATRLGIPLTSDFHTNFHRYSSHYGASLFKNPVLHYLRGLHNRTRATLVPTAELQQELNEQGFNDLKVVARGIDTQLFNPLRRNPELRRSWGVEDDGTPVLLMVSRVAPEKNFPLAIRAFDAVRARYPQARMVIVGDGPQRQELQKAHPEVHFAGMQHDMALAEHYASADIFVFSSLSETFGNVTIEAMASGLAVVAFRYAAAREYIRHGVNGLLAQPDDEGGFISAVEHLAGEQAIRRELGQQACLTAMELGWERICDDFERTLMEVLEDGHADH